MVDLRASYPPELGSPDQADGAQAEGPDLGSDGDHLGDDTAIVPVIRLHDRHPSGEINLTVTPVAPSETADDPHPIDDGALTGPFEAIDDATSTGQVEVVQPDPPATPTSDERMVGIDHNDPTAMTSVVEAALAEDDLGPLDPTDGVAPLEIDEPDSDTADDPDPGNLTPSQAGSTVPPQDAGPATEPKARRRLFGRRRNRRAPQSATQPSEGSANPMANDLDPALAVPQAENPSAQGALHGPAAVDPNTDPNTDPSNETDAEATLRRPRRNVILPPDRFDAIDSPHIDDLDTGEPATEEAHPAEVEHPHSQDDPSLFDGPPPVAPPVPPAPLPSTSGVDVDVDPIGWVSQDPLVEPAPSVAEGDFVLEGFTDDPPAEQEDHEEEDFLRGATLFGSDGEVPAGLHPDDQAHEPSVEAATELFAQPAAEADWQPLDDVTAAGLSAALSGGISFDDLIEEPPTTESQALEVDSDDGVEDDEVGPTGPMVLFPEEYPAHSEDEEVAELDDGRELDEDGFPLEPTSDHASVGPDTVSMFDDYVPSWAEPEPDLASMEIETPPDPPEIETEFVSMEAILAGLPSTPPVPAPLVPGSARDLTSDADLPEAEPATELTPVVADLAPNDEPDAEFAPISPPLEAEPATELVPAVILESTTVAPLIDLADLPEEPGLLVDQLVPASALATMGSSFTTGRSGDSDQSAWTSRPDVFAELADLDGTEGIRGLLDGDPDSDGHIDAHDWWDFGDGTQRNDDRGGFRAAANATEAVDLSLTEQIRLGTDDLAAPPSALTPGDLDALDGPESEAYEDALHAFFDSPLARSGDDTDDTDPASSRKSRPAAKATPLDLFGDAGVADDRDGVDRWVEDTEDTHGDWLERTRRTTVANLVGALLALAAVIGLLFATFWVVNNL